MQTKPQVQQVRSKENLDRLRNEWVNKVTSHFIQDESNLLQKKDMAAIRAAADTWLAEKIIPPKERQIIIDTYIRRAFGYGDIEPLLADPDISDIAIYGPGHVWVKRNGIHEQSNIVFNTEKDVDRFVMGVATKLKISLSAVEALVTKTDRESNKHAILRISIVSKKLTSSECHNIHFRKIMKDKVTLNTLIEREMVDERLARYLTKCARESSGMVFCGRGAAGKTTLMNALIDQINPRDSAAIIQENEELFTADHEATYMWHVDIGAGESRVSYTLQDLARQALLMDIDYFIIGEVKGAEARYIITAANTGTTCWCTVHGNNSKEALGKLADYIKSHPDYSHSVQADIFPMLVSLRTVVFLKNYKVVEISEVTGIDRNRGELTYRTIYNRNDTRQPWKVDENGRPLLEKPVVSAQAPSRPMALVKDSKGGK